MATATRLTLDEFLALEDTKPYHEYVCGEVIAKPMPKRRHAFIQIFLGGLLLQFLARTKLGRAGTEWRCILGPPGKERAPIPDLMYVAQHRLTEDEDFYGAPDLVVEIISPGQSIARLMEKLQFYLRHGVRMVWLIDPAERTVLALQPDQDSRLLMTGDTLDGGDVLPGFRVAVDDIFAQMEIEPGRAPAPRDIGTAP
jgi:Uma2 family endonuclease